MRAARLELYPHERVRAKARHHSIMRNGRPSVAPDSHAGSNAAVTSDRLVHSAPARHDTGAQRDVVPFDLTLSERRNKGRVDLWRPRDYEQPARVLIEPVNDPSPRYERKLRIQREQRIL